MPHANFRTRIIQLFNFNLRPPKSWRAKPKTKLTIYLKKNPKPQPNAPELPNLVPSTKYNTKVHLSNFTKFSYTIKPNGLHCAHIPWSFLPRHFLPNSLNKGFTFLLKPAAMATRAAVAAPRVFRRFFCTNSASPSFPFVPTPPPGATPTPTRPTAEPNPQS